MRRSLVGSVAMVVFLSTSGFALTAEAAFTRAPWIQDASPTTITVAWEAGTSGGTQKLVWGLGAAQDHTTNAVNVSFNLYEAKLTGLSSSSKFSYKVTSNSDVSAAGTFVTAPAGSAPFRFGVYGDNRTNSTDHASVVAAAVPFTPDFMVNTGDLSDVNSYTQFMQIENPLLANTPMFPVPGNHDVTTFFQYGFDRPNYYSFKWANAFYVMISTDDSYAVGSTQYNWVQAQLVAAKADPTVQWIFAVHHYPVYSSSNHGSTPDMQTTLNPLFKQYGVDIVFNGHDHNYERLEKDGIVYIVAGGGGAPLYASGSQPGTMYSESVNSLAMVDIDGGHLDLKAFRTDGTMMDERVIEKSVAPTPTPTASATPTATSTAGTPTPTPSGTGTPGNSGNGGGHGGCDIGAVSGSDFAGMLGASLAGLVAAVALIRRRS
jgi:hypothetical protein